MIRNPELVELSGLPITVPGNGKNIFSAGITYSVSDV
jgi:hypothetical protein